MASVGVALSGGGYRASLFGLGVLLYLADADRNSDVTSIASVSGGSITNGFVAQLGKYQSKSGPNFWKEAQRLARTIARETLWLTPAVYVYLGSMVSSLIAIVYVSFWLVPSGSWAQMLSLLLLLLPWAWLLQMRGTVAGLAFRSKLFSGLGTPRLDDIEQDIDHVFCATHLNAGEHFYFSGRFVYSYRFGWGVPGGLPLHAAVQASAAFPGAFPPRWMRTKRFSFEGGKDREGYRLSLVTLADGGVYDNVADQWAWGVRDRARQRPDLRLRVPDELIVVNASAGLKWSSVRNLRIPIIGELLALTRNASIMYDNSASLRMRSLVDRFRSSNSLRGALVTIEQSPLRVAQSFANGDSARSRRAQAVIAQFEDPEQWARIAAASAAVPTTLSKLGTEVSGSLIRHGYATAMANLHVLLDYPLLELPEPDRFEALAC